MAKITQKWVCLCLRHKKIDSAAGKKSLRMAVTEELTYDPIALLRESSGQQLHKCSVTLKLV